MTLGQWIGFFVFVVSLYILWQIRQVLLLLFAAVVFAVVLNRVVQWLQQRGAKRSVAIVISVVSLLAIVALLFASIVPAFVSQLAQLTDLVPVMLERLRNWLNWVQTQIPENYLDVRNLGSFIPRLQPIVTQLFGNVYTWFSDLLAIILNVLLVLILSIMLVASPQPYRQGLLLMFPSFYRRRADEILSRCEATLVGWLAATLFNMAVIAIVSFIGLSLLGVPLALANALLAGLLEFIPNIGPTLSVIPPAAVGMLDAPWKGGAVVILYLLIQQFESYLLVPFVMKKQVDLLPVVTLLAVIIFGSFFGFLGIFLSVPLVIVFKIWLQETLIEDILNKWEREEPIADASTDASGELELGSSYDDGSRGTEATENSNE